MNKIKFMIKSDVLDKLEPEIIKVIEIITTAIKNKQPILIRHHGDTDGYSGAVALERAILPLIYDTHTRERDAFHYYRRLPCKAPFYSYSDVVRDITNFMNDLTRFELKTPLIIIIDNGSSIQDLPAIKKAKVYGAKVIVIDHHPTSGEVDKYVNAHVNPHDVGSNSEFSAGMVCAEIGKLLSKKDFCENNLADYELIAAVSGTADRFKSRELNEYINLASKEGYSEELIRDIAMALDYETFYLGVINSRDLINDLLGADPGRQKKSIAIIKELAQSKIDVVKKAIEKYVKVEEKGEYNIARINVEKIKDMFEFPSKGKTTSIMLDYVFEKYNKPTVAMSLNTVGINFRCSKAIEKFDVNEIISILKKKLPYANIDGGGHRVAGSIRFIGEAKEEVVAVVDEYVGKL